MSKPILDIQIRTPDDVAGTVKAVFDTGSFHTLLRGDKVPSPHSVVGRKIPWTLRTAVKGSKLTVVGEVSLVLTIGNHQVNDVALVCPELAQEMHVGAGTMQKWDISIVNRNGHTEVTVGRDMNDPDITEVD